MFRYIGLIWDDSQTVSSATAGRFGLDTQSMPDWQSVLVGRGLQVFATGMKPGVNGAYPVAGSRGAVLGRLFRRPGAQAAGHTDPSLDGDDGDRILRTGGRSLVTDYWGRYVAFLQGPGGGTSILRDPTGALPCHVMRHEGVWIVFSWLEDVLTAFRDLPRPVVSGAGLAAHLDLGESSGRETVLAGVLRVLPGELIRLGADAEDTTLLWNPVEFARSPTMTDPAAAGMELRETVRACTGAWASCYQDILLRLSGGVDSSILASCLSRAQTTARVTCVNYHSPGSDSDERGYARLAAARAGCELVERERDSGFRLERILTMARTPAPVAYVGRLASLVDAELAAAHGAPALFTGAGGDTVFFEYSFWWPAADYLRQHGPGIGFPGAAMDAARLGGCSVWRTVGLAAADLLRRRLPPPPVSLYPSLLSPTGDRRAHLYRDARFVHRALLAAGCLPIGKLTQTRHLMHPIGYYDPFGREAAPEAVHPLLSQPLVELCLRLPTFVLTRGGRGRALARSSFSDDLPPEVRVRRSKGGMEEFSTAVLLNNLDFARSLLMDGELVRRGFLDRSRLERALAAQPSTFTVHVGEIHRLIGIEAWLSHWPGRDAHQPT